VVAAALADDLVRRRETDEVVNPDDERIAVENEAPDRFLHGHHLR
jgi:hypothetical protein